MIIDSITSCIALLRQNQLLNAERMVECDRDQANFSDPRVLAKHLVRLGWLTTFQVNQLFLGRGKELVIGNYRILDPIGQGGVSQVYKAWDTKRQCIAAVKVVRPDLLANPEA